MCYRNVPISWEPELSMEGLHHLLKGITNVMWIPTLGSTREQWFDELGPAFASVGPVAVSTTYVDMTFRTILSQVLSRAISIKHETRYARFCNLNPAGNHTKTFISMRGPTTVPFCYETNPVPSTVFSIFCPVTRRSLETIQQSVLIAQIIV